MRISAYLIAPLAAFLLLGCAVHKVDEEPEGRLPEYTEYTDPPGVTSPLPSPWWKAFGDEDLNALIEESLGSNYQVAELAARYRGSLALTDEARALRYPSVDAVAEEAIEINDSDFRDFTELGGALFWEVDIFNRLGYQESAFSAEAQASSEDLDALRLTLSAEIAETYYSAIEEKLRLELLRDQRERDSLLLDLTELRFVQGVSSAVDVLQQKSQLEDTVSLIPSSEAAYVVFENALYLEKKQAERLVILKQRKDVLQQTANETRYRYMQGLTDYLPVLTAVQELRQIERNILTEERILVGYRIRLFRAIGGPVEAPSEGLAGAHGRNDS